AENIRVRAPCFLPAGDIAGAVTLEPVAEAETHQALGRGMLTRLRLDHGLTSVKSRSMRPPEACSPRQRQETAASIISVSNRWGSSPRYRQRARGYQTFIVEALRQHFAGRATPVKCANSL